jgi:hypothetical protein
MITDDFDTKWKYYDTLKDRNEFRSVWSIYEVKDMYEFSGLEAENLVYKDHWGHEQAVTVPLPAGKLTWWDLWSAADKAIIESDDSHHIFIEDFKKSKDGKTLFLRTGS